MLNKSFFFILFFLILCQVTFSFYYSSEIINQNNQINQNETLLETLKIENQELEKQLATISSLEYLQNHLYQKNYIKIENQLTLQN